MSTTDAKRTADVAEEDELLSLVPRRGPKRVKIESGHTTIRVTYGARHLASCNRYVASNKHSATLTRVVAAAEEDVELPVRFDTIEAVVRRLLTSHYGLDLDLSFNHVMLHLTIASADPEGKFKYCSEVLTSYEYTVPNQKLTIVVANRHNTAVNTVLF